MRNYDEVMKLFYSHLTDDDQANEEWRPAIIDGAESDRYIVSNLGRFADMAPTRIYHNYGVCCDIPGFGRCWMKNVTLNRKNGYPRVSLGNSFVASVVVANTFDRPWTNLAKKAEQFHEEKHIKVMHIDHNKRNNRAINLIIGTFLENNNDSDVRKDNLPYCVGYTKDGVRGVVWNKNMKNVTGTAFSFTKFPEDVAIAAALLNAWRLSNVVGGPLYVQYAVRQEFYKRGGPALITPKIESIIDENIKKTRRNIEESRTQKQLQMVINDDNTINIK